MANNAKKEFILNFDHPERFNFRYYWAIYKKAITLTQKKNILKLVYKNAVKDQIEQFMEWVIHYENAIKQNNE